MIIGARLSLFGGEVLLGVIINVWGKIIYIMYFVGLATIKDGYGQEIVAKGQQSV